MTQVLSHEGSIDASSRTDDCTRSVLAFVHQLLVDSGAEPATWDERLKKLAEAFQAEGAGLAVTTVAEGGTWARRMDRARLQQRLEDMTLVVARLSHDFGNVLTGIMGFTELGLAQLAPESTAFERIQQVYEAAQRGVELIGRLNQFSQRAPKHWRPSSLATVTAEETSRLQVAWQPRVTLHVTIPSDLPPVALDVASLRHLLATLLDNARQAIPADGTVTLMAELTKITAQDCLDLLGHPAPGPAVLLSVQDTGTGFSPEARRRVFAEPFFSTKPRHQGMGLLSLYGILRRFGGGLRLEQGREGGTTARVYLPVASPSPPRAGIALESGQECGRVLIAEDDPMMRRLMKTTLEQAGFEVHTACDGVEALELVRGRPGAFQLVLTDLIMPRMDGFELVRRLVERDPGVQVLFTSSHVPAGFDQESFGGRQFALLTKPFQPEGLVWAARAALGQVAEVRS